MAGEKPSGSESDMDEHDSNHLDSFQSPTQSLRRRSLHQRPPLMQNQEAASPSSKCSNYNYWLIFLTFGVLYIVIAAVAYKCVNKGEEFETLKRAYAQQKENISSISKELETLKKKYEEQEKQLNESNYNASTYIKHLDLIATIDKALKNMESCKLVLDRYCFLKAELKAKSELSVQKDAEGELNRLHQLHLGCKDELPADYNLKIKGSYQEHLKNILNFRKALLNLMIDGKIDEMAAEQNRSSNVPADTCQFICTLPVLQKSSEDESEDKMSIFDAGWAIFKTFIT